MFEQPISDTAFSTSNCFNTASFQDYDPRLGDVITQVKLKLQLGASSSSLFSQVFKDKAETPEISSVHSAWASGDFSLFPQIAILSNKNMGSATGAYASSTNTIYLSDTQFQLGAEPLDSLAGVAGVLTEEIFHWLDDRTGSDTIGDEGELAKYLLFGVALVDSELSRIQSENDQGFITINGQSVLVEKNDTLATAIDLGTLNTVTLARSGWVGTYREWWGNNHVPNDYYRFRLNSATKIDIKLMNLENDVDLYLLNTNGNVISSSTKSGRTEDIISTQLSTGNYYIHVKQFNGNSRYDLAINSFLIPSDFAGNNRGSARHIGTLGTSNSTYSDWVGDLDRDDYYSLHLNGTRDLRLSLTGLTSDADVQILNNSGAVIASSTQSSNTSESISLNNLSAGTYYARVYQYRGDTYYTLNLRAEDRVQQFIPIVSQLYSDVLNREPDAGGLQHWANAMVSGMTYSQVRSAIANSQESQNNVSAAYQNILLRNPDSGGLQGYVNALANNWTLRQVYESIATSNEARSNFWTARYFNNTSRTGSVVFAQSFGRTNTGFDRNWGTGSPSGWVNTDNFSARIFGQVSFGAGLQEIRVQSDDGIRVRIGEQTVIDRLVDQPFVLNTGTFNAGNGGTFNVEIEYYERGGAAALNFSSRPLTPPDQAGNTFGAARNIGTLNGSLRFTDWVGNLDSNDYYRFDVTTQSNFSLNLGGLSADADVELLNSSGSVIFRSTNSGNTAEAITRQLGAGTYYTRVYSFNGTNNTNYNLSLSSVSLSSQIRSGSENVNLWLYDSNGRNTTNYINPNRDTIVVIHGWNNSDQSRWIENKWIESPGINRLARKAAEFGQQVLALDWGGIAADPNDLDSWLGDAVPDETAQWITPVAKWASGLLSNLGIASNQLTLIGHSLGTYVASEIGRNGGQVRNLIALDPADNANSFTNYDLDCNTPGTQNPVRFDSVAQYSLSFVVSDDAAHVAGDNYRAATAHDSFLVKNWTGWRLTTAIDTHGGVVDIFRNALDRRFLDLNNLSSSRPFLVRNWYDNKGDVDNILDRRNNRGLHEGAINARWTGSDWRIDGLQRVVRTSTDWLGNEYGIEEWTWT